MTMFTITETIRSVLARPLGWLVLLPVFVAIAATLYPWHGTRNVRIRLVHPRRPVLRHGNLLRFRARRHVPVSHPFQTPKRAS